MKTVVSKQEIRDSKLNRLGWLVLESNGDTTALDARGVPAGKFLAGSNETRDASGRRLTYGNTAVALIMRGAR